MHQNKIITSAVRLSEDLHKDFKELAKQKHTGMSTLIRQAMSEFLEKSKPKTEDEQLLELLKSIKTQLQP